MDKFSEYLIHPSKAGGLVNDLAVRAAQSQDVKLQDEEPEIECPYGDEACEPESADNMCDSCREEQAQSHREAMMDTYD